LKALFIAILAAAPWLSPASATAYARLVERFATKHRVPSLLLAAIVTHESGWRAGAVNSHSGATGLGQVLPSAYGPCRGQTSCAPLLDPAVNLNASAAILRANFRYCGGKRWDRALAGYQTGGCAPVGMTHNVLRAWKRLERSRFASRRRSR
jgi:soluble lytic murein transglycosylase-like protein